MVRPFLCPFRFFAVFAFSRRRIPFPIPMTQRQQLSASTRVGLQSQAGAVALLGQEAVPGRSVYACEGEEEGGVRGPVGEADQSLADPVAVVAHLTETGEMASGFCRAAEALHD